MNYRDLVATSVDVELDRQNEKWGDQSWLPDIGGWVDDWAWVRHYEKEAFAHKRVNENHVELGCRGWDGILLEEVYEALAECGDDDRLYEELIQVAAVAQQWAAAILRRF